MPENLDLGGQADQLIELVGNLSRGMAASNDAILASNEAITHSNERIAELGAASRHSKRMVRLLAASVAFDILLSLGLGYAISKAHDASDQNRATIHQTCVASNEARASAVHLWETLVAGAPPPTPEEKARQDNILAIVHQTYAPRNCG